MFDLSPALAGFIGSLIAGLATGVGAIPILIKRSWSALDLTLLLAAAAGIMLAATFFSLILPALEASQAQGVGRLAASGIVITGMIVGAVAIQAVNSAVPHEHEFKGREGFEGPLATAQTLSRPMLLVVAIALHNVPEGLSVGVGFSGPNAEAGLALTIGIGLQNMPEGLAVAAALVDMGVNRQRAFVIALASGLAEPVASLFSIAAVSISQDLIPWALAFAAGAMLFVTSGEVIPETHRKGMENRATFALIGGFVVMMALSEMLA